MSTRGKVSRFNKRKTVNSQNSNGKNDSMRMTEKDPANDASKGEEEGAAGKVDQEIPLVEVIVEESKVCEEPKETEEEEEGEVQVRRFRRCQRRKKTSAPVIQVFEDLKEEEEEEDEEEEEEEEYEDDAKTVSEYESVYSAVPFEWENEIYEFLDLCNPGTMENIYQRKQGNISYDVYGQANYLKICNDMNVPPVVRFYNALITSEADLSFHGLNRKQMYAICQTLEKNTTIESLILKSNALSSRSCQSLCTLLRKNGIITVLDLTGCKIGPEGVLLLARGLQFNEGLKELNLSKCYIGDQGMSYLALPLKNNYLIEKLILSWNNLSGGAADAMGTLFYSNNCVNYLDLDNNNLYDPPSMKKFFKGLIINTAITYLTLKWNALSSTEIGEALALFLKRNSTIKYLDLSDNRLDGASVKPLRKGLSGSQSLEILRLARNPLTSQDVENLLPGVKGCRNLELLDLQEIWVRKEFVKSLNKIKLSKNVDVLYEGVYSNYTIVGPDYPALILKRAQFEGMKPKKANLKREFGNLLYMMGDEPVTAEYFMEQVAAFKAKISDDLYPELIKQFTIPRAALVDVIGMRKKYMSLFPDFKPSVEKKSKPEEKEPERENKGQEIQMEITQGEEKEKVEPENSKNENKENEEGER